MTSHERLINIQRKLRVLTKLAEKKCISSKKRRNSPEFSDR